MTIAPLLGPHAVRPPFTFVVPGEPHAWERARAMAMPAKAGGGRGGVRFFNSDEQDTQQWNVREAAKKAGITPYDGPCGLDVVASWLFPRSWTGKRIIEALTYLKADPIRFIVKATRPDADNIAKLVADALQGNEPAPGSKRKPVNIKAALAFPDDGLVWTTRVAKVWGPRNETHVRIWYGDAPPPFPQRWWNV
jgi:Holliday junction resolvase RusA-like endonuclease